MFYICTYCVFTLWGSFHFVGRYACKALAKTSCWPAIINFALLRFQLRLLRSANAISRYHLVYALRVAACLALLLFCSLRYWRTQILPLATRYSTIQPWLWHVVVHVPVHLPNVAKVDADDVRLLKQGEVLPQMLFKLLLLWGTGTDLPPLQLWNKFLADVQLQLFVDELLQVWSEQLPQEQFSVPEVDIVLLLQRLVLNYYFNIKVIKLLLLCVHFCQCIAPFQNYDMYFQSY